MANEASDMAFPRTATMVRITHLSDGICSDILLQISEKGILRILFLQ